jgi:hypothetical protein
MSEVLAWIVDVFAVLGLPPLAAALVAWRNESQAAREDWHHGEGAGLEAVRSRWGLTYVNAADDPRNRWRRAQDLLETAPMAAPRPRRADCDHPPALRLETRLPRAEPANTRDHVRERLSPPSEGSRRGPAHPLCRMGVARPPPRERERAMAFLRHRDDDLGVVREDVAAGRDLLDGRRHESSVILAEDVAGSAGLVWMPVWRRETRLL